MSATVVEAFDDVAAWRRRRPTGATSNLLTIALTGPARLQPAAGAPARPTATLAAAAGAADHRFERTGPALDLTGADDLVLWVRGDRRADGSADHPFFARIELGSVALAPDAPTNTWRRFVPVLSPGAWEYVPLALGDLDPAVRAALTTIRLTVLGDAGWRLDLDAVLAVRDEPLADTDAAVLALLHRRVRAAGDLVDAVVEPVATTPAAPYIRIVNTALRVLPAAAAATPSRTDFVATGFALRRPNVPAELTYRVDVVGDERGPAAQAVGGVLRELFARDVLVVAGRPCRLDVVDPVADIAAVPVEGAAVPPIHLRISTSVARPAAPERAVPPFESVTVEVDHAS